MKFLIGLNLIIFFFFQPVIFNQQSGYIKAQCSTWTQKANFAAGTLTAGAVGFSIGTKGYIGTGFAGGSTKDFWEYDQSTNTWTQKADFGGTARNSAVGMSIGNKGYIGTGIDAFSVRYQDFWEYDTTGNVWTQKTDFGGVARNEAVGFSIGGKGYIGTGAPGSSFLNDFWEYDPIGDTWTQKTDFGGVVRRGAVGFSIGNKGYIGTGGDGVSEYKDFWEYDPVGDTWTQKTDFGGTERRYAVGLSIGDKGYVGTGFLAPSVYTDDFWEFNPTTNSWTQKASFTGGPRYIAVGFSIGSKGYIGTGTNSPPLYDDFWLYLPGITADAGPNASICLGDSTVLGGSPTATGNFTSYSYLWTPSAGLNDSTIANPTATPLVTTTYTVVVTDTNGCTATDAITVTLPDPIIPSIAKSNVSCFGFNDGVADLIISGGFAPYTYVWSDSSTTQDISGLAPGTYTVSITGSCGATATDTVIITEPSSSIVAFAGNDISVCVGDTAWLGGSPTGSGGTPPYNYSWSPKPTVTSQTASNPGAFPGTSTTYFVNVSDSNGCSVIDTVNVNIFIIQPQPICLITVDSTSTRNIVVWEKPSTAGIDSFRIYRDIIGTYTHIGSVHYDSLSFYTDTSAGINPQITSYRYKISAVDTCGNEGDTSTFHKTIHLQVIPGIPPAMELSWDDYEGFSFTYYRILRDSTGLGNWEAIDSVSFGINSRTDPTPPQTTNLNYMVEVVSPSVCIATKQQNFNSSKSNTSTGVASGILTATATSSNASLGNCDGSATVAANGGLTPYTYLWNDPSAQTTQTASGLCPGIFAVLVTDVVGDTVSVIITVIESTGVPPTSNFIATSVSITVGDSIDFIDLSTNAPTSWSWIFVNGSPATSNMQNPTGIEYNSVGCFDVILIVTNAFGSDTLTQSCYINVAVGGSPPITAFIASTTSIVVGDSVDFIDLSSNNPTSWLWLFPNGNPSNSTLQNPTGISYGTTGCYDVTLMATNAFGTDTLVKTCYIGVAAAGAPPVGDFVASDTSINVGTGINYLDLSSNSPTGWTWLFSGASPGFSTDQNPLSITYSTTGCFETQLIVSNGFGADTVLKICYITVGAVGIPEDKVFQDLKVYPNPGKGIFTIEYNYHNSDQVKVMVADVLGRVLMENDIESGPSGNPFVENTLVLTHLPAGVYYLSLASDNQVVGRRLVIIE